MIFVTVGSQMPFDRMVKTIDEWSAASRVKVVAQVGRSSMATQYVERHESLSPLEFSDMVRRCDLLVGHAGMGTVLTGLEYGKPMLLMPRLAEKVETRNDHQVSTLRWLKDKPGIYAAFDEFEMLKLLDQWAVSGYPSGPGAVQVPESRLQLIGAIRGFVEGRD